MTLSNQAAKTVLIGAGAAALLGTGLAVPAASAAGQAKPVTIRFLSVTRTSLRLPTGGADIFVSKNLAGKVIGSDTLNCLGSTESNLRCAFTLDLARGELLGTVTPTADGANGQILAGTNKYAKSVGSITAHNLNQTRTSVTIILRG